MDWQRLKTAVAAVIKQNGNQDITGKVLQDTLLSTINNIGAGRTFSAFAIADSKSFLIIEDAYLGLYSSKANADCTSLPLMASNTKHAF